MNHIRLGDQQRTRPKYGNQKTLVAGHVFDSKREAERYQLLCILERAGRISDLELQPKYRLDVDGIHVADYIADFRYKDSLGFTMVEDAKGVRTAVYRLKKKLMLAIHGIDILET